MALRWNINASKKSAATTRDVPWFLVTMLLGGFVIGFGVRTWFPPPSVGPAPKPQAPAAKQAPTPAARPTTAKEVLPVDPAVDHIRGPKNASITVIEYSDFECPFCKRFHPIMKELLAKDPDVQWVYRHFPLPMHRNAQKAAEAAECVAELAGDDAYWAMTDALIALQAVTDDALVKAAVAAGAPEKAFQDCLTSGKMADVVKKFHESGAKAGITGTPGSIVIHNPSGTNEIVRGAKQLPALQATIEKLRSGKAPSAAPSAAQLQTIKIVIDNGTFTPATVALTQDSLTVLEFSAKSGPASVKIPGLKISTDVTAATPKRIRVQTGTPGTYKDATGKFTVTIAR